jgi:NAD-dependent dihydropyrimidine dehydrogenase PreA subunit
MTEGCSPASGRVRPVIDRSRCEAKGDCVHVCPYGVFALRALTGDERRPLSWRAKLKLWVHGGKQAFAVKADECHACGKCVEACPERAISLEGVEGGAAPPGQKVEVRGSPGK